jgi:hypothetical protein
MMGKTDIWSRPRIGTRRLDDEDDEQYIARQAAEAEAADDELHDMVEQLMADAAEHRRCGEPMSALTREREARALIATTGFSDIAVQDRLEVRYPCLKQVGGRRQR